MQTEAIASRADTEAQESKRWCHLAYECPNCQMTWQDQWDVLINGDCPNCGAQDIEPQEIADLSR